MRATAKADGLSLGYRPDSAMAANDPTLSGYGLANGLMALPAQPPCPSPIPFCLTILASRAKFDGAGAGWRLKRGCLLKANRV